MCRKRCLRLGIIAVTARRYHGTLVLRDRLLHLQKAERDYSYGSARHVISVAKEYNTAIGEPIRMHERTCTARQTCALKRSAENTSGYVVYPDAKVIEGGTFHHRPPVTTESGRGSDRRLWLMVWHSFRSADAARQAPLSPDVGCSRRPKSRRS